MIEFDLFKASKQAELETVWIEPLAVASVVTSERRQGYGGWHRVAVITMNHGEVFTVLDYGRTAAGAIAVAKAQYRAQEKYDE